MELHQDGDLKHEIIRAIDVNEALKARYKELSLKKLHLENQIYMTDNQLQEGHSRLCVLEKSIPPCKKPVTNFVGKVFSKAQVRLLLGRKKVVWTDLDLAKAFSLRHMGGRKCYLYLKDTLNIPLPALSAVQRWAAANSETSNAS